jgi:hypothetical protein
MVPKFESILSHLQLVDRCLGNGLAFCSIEAEIMASSAPCLCRSVSIGIVVSSSLSEATVSGEIASFEIAA